ncbi:MAG: phosphoribosylamine--glycine ligase [Ignavibacteriae bacterium]|nr:phosphoribosylamine--glycine ligase [Ignavibacteriota bacterium]
MKILVIGSGGREHALVWKLKQSKQVQKLFCGPGNPGIAEHAECVPIKANDIEALKKFALEQNVDLTIVGPEQPLVDGIVDEFESAGLKIFGPSKFAAQLEGSKIFAKQFMRRHNIPTAKFETFESHQITEAKDFISNCSLPIVIKADGLAAGKGVAICLTKNEATEILHQYFEERVFADAGTRIVIEEFMEGEEASIFALTDGKNFVTLSPAQDHKRVFDNDEGKNTGGMGAYAPAPIVSAEILEHVKEAIIQPTLDGMLSEGHPYKGCLYVGLMLTNDGPKVVEYNCRLGDPETQVILPLLDEDLAELMLEVAEGKLNRTEIKLKNQSAVCVVLASGGYPDEYQTGKEIFGLELIAKSPHVIAFHAGTKTQNIHLPSTPAAGTAADKKLKTNGGRVLGVTALGDSLGDAIKQIYQAVDNIHFDGMHFRRDIGYKGLQRTTNKEQ